MGSLRCETWAFQIVSMEEQFKGIFAGQVDTNMPVFNACAINYAQDLPQPEPLLLIFLSLAHTEVISGKESEFL